MDPSSPHMLRAIDRFLAVAAAAPGLVALQSGSDGPGHLGALVLSYLTSRLGFDAESAVAWVRMVHPALLASPAGPSGSVGPNGSVGEGGPRPSPISSGPVPSGPMSPGLLPGPGPPLRVLRVRRGAGEARLVGLRGARAALCATTRGA